VTVTEPDPEAVRAFWSEFAAASGVTGEPVEVFAFGDSARMADELGALVVAGTKQATAGLLADYDAESEPLPQVGDHEVVHLADGRPVAVIRNTEVRVAPLSSVDERFAWDEGEGDRSLAYWMDAHERFFRRRCAALGIDFDHSLPVVLVRFATVWPPPHTQL